MTSQKPFLLIIGAPGAGKGTQAAKLAADLGIPTISTGDIFRANIKEQTDLGKQVQSLIEAGEFVPDDLTNEIVADRLAQPDAADGFLLDGYPRTIPQANYLEQMMAERGEKLAAVIMLDSDRDEVVARLLQRAELEGRADDTAEVIGHRQDVYVEQTRPLIAHYREQGLLVTVDGLGEIDEVAARIKAALSERLQ